MPTIMTALLLGAQIAESGYSHFQKLMEKETAAWSAGRYAEAERLGREAEVIARSLPDPDSALILIRNELAGVLAWQGRHGEAAVLLEQALPVAMKLSSRVHLITAVNLGAAYRVTGRLDDARLVLNQALRVPEVGELAETLAARSELAAIEALLGRRKAAYALLSEVLAEQTSRLGLTHGETLSTLSSLIECLIAWKRFDEAGKLAFRYLDGNAHAEASGHPSQALGHYYLGIIAKERKSYGEASERLHRALEILEASVGRRSASVAILLNALASIESKRHRFAAALALSLEAVSICEEALGPRHRETGAMLQAHAEILDRLRFRVEARQSRARAIEIAKKSATGIVQTGLMIDWGTWSRGAGR